MKLLLLVLFVHYCISQSQAKKVVFFPFFQGSHITSSIKVAQALSDLQHETWVCAPKFIYNKGILNPGKVKIVTYGNEHEDLDADFFNKSGMLDTFWSGSVSFMQMIAQTQSYMKNISYHIFSSQSFISALEDIKPDYFVLDSMPLVTNFLVLPYKFQVPFSVLGVAYDIIGARVPFSPAGVPSMFFQESYTSETTFFQRLKKTFAYFIMLVTDTIWDPRIAEMLVPEKTPPSSSRSLILKADLHLVENDVILGYSYPQLSNTIMIGGTSAAPAKELPEKFQKIARNSKNGIVLVTFGSSVANIPSDLARKMTTAFMQLPFHVVWRINITSPDETKITTSTWIPQNDLLGHKDGATVKVFVSHCGAWGQYESLYHGVPLLCLPIFSEQLFNAHRIQDKGFGTFADIRTISAEDLASLILEVASNETYRRTIKQASALYRELYKSPTKSAAYWLDHVLKHGAKHLRSPGQDMPVYQLLLLDVLAFVVFIVIVLVCSAAMMVRCCCTRCRRKQRTAGKKLKKK